MFWIVIILFPCKTEIAWCVIILKIWEFSFIFISMSVPQILYYTEPSTLSVVYARKTNNKYLIQIINQSHIIRRNSKIIRQCRKTSRKLRFSVEYYFLVLYFFFFNTLQYFCISALSRRYYLSQSIPVSVICPGGKNMSFPK